MRVLLALAMLAYASAGVSLYATEYKPSTGSTKFVYKRDTAWNTLVFPPTLTAETCGSALTYTLSGSDMAYAELWIEVEGNYGCVKDALSSMPGPPRVYLTVTINGVVEVLDGPTCTPCNACQMLYNTVEECTGSTTSFLVSSQTSGASYAWTGASGTTFSSQTAYPSVSVSGGPFCESQVSFDLAVTKNGQKLVCSGEVTITDRIKPTLKGISQDAAITAECTDVPSVMQVSAVDDCLSHVNVDFDESTEVSSTSWRFPYQFTRQWTAEDNCYNTAIFSQVITVQDTQKPVLHGVEDDAQLPCNGVPVPCNVYATDNCGHADLEVDFTEKYIGNSCPSDYTLLRTWSTVDQAGNTISETQTIDVVDTEAPVLEGAPTVSQTSVACDEVSPGAAVYADDNCDQGIEVLFTETRTGHDDSTPYDYVIVRTWSASDACGNAATVYQTLDVTDKVAPTLSGVEADKTVECDLIPPECVVTVQDNCDGGAVLVFVQHNIKGDCDQEFIRIYQWTATDSSGNHHSESQTITVVDTAPPVMHLAGIPTDLTVECDAIPDYTVTADDSCQEGEVDIDFTEVFFGRDGDDDAEYSVTRTWTATDECGNPTPFVQNLVVVDNNDPRFSVVPEPFVFVACKSIPEPADISATDDCCEAEVTFAEVREDGSCAYEYDLVRTWTAIDCSGNTATFTQTVSVEDTTAPTRSSTPVSFECSWPAPPMETITATDDCGDATVTPDETITDGTCDDNWVSLRTWFAVDECGNSDPYTQTITVVDHTQPTLSEYPSDEYVDCNAIPDAHILTAVDITDEERATSVIMTEWQEPPNNVCDYKIIRVYTTQDRCGNVETHSYTISVTDKTPPVIDDVQPITELGLGDGFPSVPVATDNCDPDVVVTYTDVQCDLCLCMDGYTITRTYSAVDRCENDAEDVEAVFKFNDYGLPTLLDVPDDDEVTCKSAIPPMFQGVTSPDGEVTVVETVIASSCYNRGVLKRTWTATNACGNFTRDSQIITWVDSEAPTFTIPEDATYACTVPDGQPVEWTDNCGMIGTAYPQETASQDGKTIYRTWSAEDECSNFDRYTQTITLNDEVPPVFDPVDDASYECQGATPTPSVSDNCVNYSLDHTTSVTEGDCAYESVTLHTWTATDTNGNKATINATITVTSGDFFDIEVIDAAVDDHCVAGAEPNHLKCDCDQSTPPVMAAIEDCSGYNINVEYSVEEEPNPGEGVVSVEYRTWSATDSCGNFASRNQTSTAVDTELPTWKLPLAEDRVFECEVEDPPPMYADDNCEGVITPVHTQESTSSGCDETIVHTWTATDLQGRIITHVATYSVVDLTAPVFNVNPVDPQNPTATDNCQLIGVQCTPQIVPGECGMDDTHNVCVATDACGNTATVTTDHVTAANSYVIAVVPKLEDVDADCEATLEDPVVCSDGSDVIRGVVITPDAVGCAQNKVVSRTWSCQKIVNGKVCAADTHTQHVYVVDDKPPTVEAPDGVTVECDAIPAITDAVAEDNCDTNPSFTYEYVDYFDVTADAYNNFYRVVTYTAQDHCSYTSTDVMTITVKDTTPPVCNEAPADITEEYPPTSIITLGSGVDNCSNVTSSPTEKREDGTCLYSYDLVRTWSCVDETGNVSEQTLSQIVHVEDTTPPVLSVTSVLDITLDWPQAVPDAAVVTASDNADTVVHVVYTYEDEKEYTIDEHALDNYFDLDVPDRNYTIVRYWVATDACGNSVDLVQTITVIDIPPLCLPVVQNVTYPCHAVVSGSATTQLVAGMLEPGWSSSYDQTRVDGSCDQEYTLYRVWTVTSDVGTVCSSTQTVTVYDTGKPIWKDLVTPVIVWEVITDDMACIPPVPVPPEAEDLCDTDVYIYAFPAVFEGHDDSNPNDFTITYEWAATDECGNTASHHTQVIQVLDKTPPKVANPDALLDAHVEACNIPAPPTIVGIDNCLDEVTVSGPTERQISFECSGGYTFVREWTLLDSSGNEFNPTQTVYVDDSKDPEWNTDFPLDANVTCAEAFPTDEPSAQDCTGLVQISVDFYDVEQCVCNSYPTGIAWPNNVSTSTFCRHENGDCYLPDGTQADTTCPHGISKCFVTVGSEVRTHIRVWTAADNCGNDIDREQVITIVNDGAPELVGVPTNKNYACATEILYPNVTGTDTCDNGMDVDYTETVDVTCTNKKTVIRTWTVTDSHNLFDTESQTVVISDTIPATLVGLPSQAVITVPWCQIPAAPTVTASDNCGAELDFTQSEQWECEGRIGTIVRTWTADDGCNEPDTFTQTIHVTSPEPTIAPVPDKNQGCTAGFDTQPRLVTDVCLGDKYTGPADITSAGECPVVNTLTWTYNDANTCDRVVTETATVTSTDGVKPWIYGIPSSRECSCTQEHCIPTFTVGDACDQSLTVDDVVITHGTHTVEGNTEFWNITFSLSDACGNELLTTMVNKLVDDVPPTYETPPHQTVQCVHVVPPTPPGVDNCDDSIVVTMWTETKHKTCDNKYMKLFHWSATDESGNVAMSTTTTITVTDSEAPTFNEETSDTENELCDAQQAPPTLTASDNCGALAVIQTTSVDNSTCIPVKTYTWTVQDLCGETATRKQTVTVVDISAPDLTITTAWASDSIECDKIIVPPTATATDNCSDNVDPTKHAPTQRDGSCDQTFYLDYGFTATDDCGNAVTDYVTILVEDTEAPTFDHTVENEVVECRHIGNEPPMYASDNCDETFPKTIVPVDVITGVNSTLKIVRTWTATDDCGNSNSLSRTITAKDTTPPVLPDLFGSGHQCVAPTADDVFAIDACAQQVIKADLTEYTIDGTCGSQFDVVRTYTATDAVGNTASTSETIYVTDTYPPVLSVTTPSGSETVECDEVPEFYEATAVDNCDGDTYIPEIRTRMDGDVEHEYTLYRTWTVVDECGNSASVTQTLVVDDTTPPEFDLPLPQDNEFEVPGEVPDAEASATDNCYEVTPVMTTVVVEGTCYDNKLYIRTWTVTDSSGNIATTTQTVEMYDRTPPVIHGVPEGEQEYSYSDVPSMHPSEILDGIYATDNSGNEIEVTYEVITTPYFDIVNGDEAPTNEYTITIIYTAVDHCGNTSELTLIIKVKDNEPCVFSDYPTNEIAECDSIPEPCVVVCEPDPYSAEVPFVDFTETVINDELGEGVVKLLLRTWASSDVAGNEESWTQTITVTDAHAPFLSRQPANVAVACDCDTFPKVAKVFALDNCDTTPQLDFTEVKSNETTANDYILTRTWTATDNLGNAHTYQQIVTVSDKADPILAGLPEDSVDASCDNVPDAASVYAIDTCDDDVVVEFESHVDDGSCEKQYTIHRHWSSTDESGNTAQFSQVINVKDDDAPALTDKRSCAVNTGSAVVIDVADLFAGADNCGSVNLVVTGCNSTSTTGAHTNGETTFIEDCASAGTTGVSVMASPGQTTNRVFNVFATVTDDCANSESVMSTVTVYAGNPPPGSNCIS